MNKLNRIANYTMEVKEWNRDIIFLHKIIPGIADSSYGIHVAELAGLPKEVINSAKQILTNFEKKESIQIKNHYKEAVTYKESEILKTLTNIDINNITPLQSQKILHELKSKIHSNN